MLYIQSVFDRNINKEIFLLFIKYKCLKTNICWIDMLDKITLIGKLGIQYQTLIKKTDYINIVLNFVSWKSWVRFFYTQILKTLTVHICKYMYVSKSCTKKLRSLSRKKYVKTANWRKARMLLGPVRAVWWTQTWVVGWHPLRMASSHCFRGCSWLWTLSTNSVLWNRIEHEIGMMGYHSRLNYNDGHI